MINSSEKSAVSSTKPLQKDHSAYTTQTQEAQDDDMTKNTESKNSPPYKFKIGKIVSPFKKVKKSYNPGLEASDFKLEGVSEFDY